VNKDACLDSGRLVGENALVPYLDPFCGLLGGVPIAAATFACVAPLFGCRSGFPAFASFNSSYTKFWLSAMDNQFKNNSSNFSLLDGNFDAALMFSFPERSPRGVRAGTWMLRDLDMVDGVPVVRFEFEFVF
jgi:hypothetical protein